MNTLFGRDDTMPDRPSKCQGHAFPPGTGPEGETCRTCRHRVSVDGGSRTYQKCKLVQKYWTSGPGTDVRCKDAACREWQPRG